MFEAKSVDPRIRLAMRVLEFEQTRPPSIGELADRVGLSLFHLSRLFACQVGESCAAYSRRIRLDNSNNQLIHDTVPLAVVAKTFGYESQAAYTRAYARQFGMPPTQYVARILGLSEADHAANHLEPAGQSAAAPLLHGRVSLAERHRRPALARRFYGYDVADHWRRFMAEVPPGLVEGAELAGMSYDNARVTPSHRFRYDCAAVFEPGQAIPRFDPASGLDAVEVPGGLHAEIAFEGTFADLWRTTIGLFTEWLPRHREYRPKGDPVVHWLHSAPTAESFSATSTIRLLPRDEQPAYNMRPLTRYGRPAGYRTGLDED